MYSSEQTAIDLAAILNPESLKPQGRNPIATPGLSRGLQALQEILIECKKAKILMPKPIKDEPQLTFVDEFLVGFKHSITMFIVDYAFMDRSQKGVKKGADKRRSSYSYQTDSESQAIMGARKQVHLILAKLVQDIENNSKLRAAKKQTLLQLIDSNRLEINHCLLQYYMRIFADVEVCIRENNLFKEGGGHSSTFDYDDADHRSPVEGLRAVVSALNRVDSHDEYASERDKAKPFLAKYLKLAILNKAASAQNIKERSQIVDKYTEEVRDYTKRGELLAAKNSVGMIFLERIISLKERWEQEEYDESPLKKVQTAVVAAVTPYISTLQFCIESAKTLQPLTVDPVSYITEARQQLLDIVELILEAKAGNTGNDLYADSNKLLKRIPGLVVSASSMQSLPKATSNTVVARPSSRSKLRPRSGESDKKSKRTSADRERMVEGAQAHAIRGSMMLSSGFSSTGVSSGRNLEEVCHIEMNVAFGFIDLHVLSFKNATKNEPISQSVKVSELRNSAPAHSSEEERAIILADLEFFEKIIREFSNYGNIKLRCLRNADLSQIWSSIEEQQNKVRELIKYLLLTNIRGLQGLDEAIPEQFKQLMGELCVSENNVDEQIAAQENVCRSLLSDAPAMTSCSVNDRVKEDEEEPDTPSPVDGEPAPQQRRTVDRIGSAESAVPVLPPDPSSPRIEAASESMGTGPAAVIKKGEQVHEQHKRRENGSDASDNSDEIASRSRQDPPTPPPRGENGKPNTLRKRTSNGGSGGSRALNSTLPSCIACTNGDGGRGPRSSTPSDRDKRQSTYISASVASGGQSGENRSMPLSVRLFGHHLMWKSAVGAELGLVAGLGTKGALMAGLLTLGGFGLIANPITATIVFLALAAVVGAVAFAAVATLTGMAYDGITKPCRAAG